MSSLLAADGLQLVIPYVIEQLNDLHSNAPQSAWLLFHPVAQAIGPSETARQFLQPLISIFDTEETSVKYLKIYHRSYISQLIVRLGLEVFLTTFSTLLVEAAACYKDFTSRCGDQSDSAVVVVDSSDHLPKMSQFDLDPELNVVNGVFENDASSDIDIINGRPESVSNLSADEDDTASATSVSALLDDQSQDDKTPDGDSVSLLSENLRTAGDNASLDNFSGSLAATSASSDSTVAVDFDVDSTHLPPQYSPPSDNSISLVSLSDYNVSNVAAETLKWLADRLGPVLTTKYISRNLLRMLTLCYVGLEQMQCVTDSQC